MTISSIRLVLLLSALASFLPVPVKCQRNSTLKVIDHHTHQAHWDGIYQGDLRMGSNMKYNKRSRRLSVSNINLWDSDESNDYFRIFVVIDGYSQEETTQIEDALKMLQYTGKAIKFVLRNSAPTSYASKGYMRIRNAGGCWSYLGQDASAFSPQGQTVSIDTMCFRTPDIQHVIFHALGHIHEHSRMDRDDYIKVNYNNIPEEYHKDFAMIEGVDTLGIPYNYRSVMHFNPYAFAEKYWKPSIESKTSEPIDLSLGRAHWNDYIGIRLKYQCVRNGRAYSRTLQEYKAEKCTQECGCWKFSAKCINPVTKRNDDKLCKGNLVCRRNVCSTP